MYRVYYYIGSNETAIAAKEFETLKEATEFSNKQPINTILEIKHYDDKTSNT